MNFIFMDSFDIVTSGVAYLISLNYMNFNIQNVMSDSGFPKRPSESNPPGNRFNQAFQGLFLNIPVLINHSTFINATF